VDCLKNLALSSAALADSMDKHLQTQAEALARHILEDPETAGLSSPQIANGILREIKRLSGVSDPYARFKIREMDQARKIFAELRGYVGADLRSLIGLAVLGNTVDFFKDPKDAFAELPDQIQRGLSFYADDIDRLEAFLANRPGLILYLTDNAGEIYFDLPLYDFIRESASRTVLVVKGGPALNDLTRADLAREKLDGRVNEIADTGTDGAGIEWEHVSQDFLDLVDRADLILSKGMANFETIYPVEISTAVFFLLKVKCRPVQEYLDTPFGSFLAFWRDGINPGAAEAEG
jgi:uncharacterized protein with ATP-grasp and redox domains